MMTLLPQRDIYHCDTSEGIYHNPNDEHTYIVFPKSKSNLIVIPHHMDFSHSHLHQSLTMNVPRPLYHKAGLLS